MLSLQDDDGIMLFYVQNDGEVMYVFYVENDDVVLVPMYRTDKALRNCECVII